MADDDKPAPHEFPVEVSVNGIKVTVTLLLRPGTVGDGRGNKDHD